MRYLKLFSKSLVVMLAGCLFSGGAFAAGTQKNLAACLERGKKEFSAKDYLQAQDIFTQCLKLDPNNTEAQLSLAGVLLTQDDLDGSEKYFTAAIRSLKRNSPYLSYTYSMLGDIDLKKQQNDEALQMYSKS